MRMSHTHPLLSMMTCTVSVELLKVHTYHFVEHDDVQFGSPDFPLVVRSIDASLVALEAVERSHDRVQIFEQEEVPDYGLRHTVLP